MITIPSLAAMSKIKDPGKYYCSENGREYVITPDGGINNGLVAFYPMGENVSSTKIIDIVEGNDATIGTALTEVSGVDGKALHFNVASNPTVPNKLMNVGSGYSFSVWINEPTNVNGATVLGGGSLDTTGGYFLYAGSGSWFHTTGTTNANYATQSHHSATFPTDGWINIIVVVYGVNDVEFYHNGVLMKSNAGVGTTYLGTTTSTTFGKIGARQGNINPWHGDIDNIRLYNRPLNPSDIQELYKEGL